MPMKESLKVYRDWNNVINTAIQKGIAEGEWMKAKAIAGNFGDTKETAEDHPVNGK